MEGGCSLADPQSAPWTTSDFEPGTLGISTKLLDRVIIHNMNIAYEGMAEARLGIGKIINRTRTAWLST